MTGICRYSQLGCALCLLAWVVWERENAEALEPYYTTIKTGDRMGERVLDVYYAQDPLMITRPPNRPAATIAPITMDGVTVAVAVCYEHLASTATDNPPSPP